MSSLPFPHLEHTSESGHDGPFYNPSFDTSSFQMNPLSSHPPRTPRASHVSSASHIHSHSHSQTYGSASVYDEKSDGSQQTIEQQQHDDDEDGSELNEEDVKVQEAEKKVHTHDVWREMLVTSNGRDKAFKIIQYSIRVYLVFHTSLVASRLFRKLGSTRPPWEVELVRRLESARGGLSFTRKTLILFNWLAPLSTIMAQQSVPFSAEHHAALSQSAIIPPHPPSKLDNAKPFLQALLSAPPPVLLELVNGLSDDMYTFSRLGLIGKRAGERAARFSDWCWFLGTLVGLVENGVERNIVDNMQTEVESRMYKESMAGATAKSKPTASKLDGKELARLQSKSYWLQVSRAKLAMDLIFVSYDIFRIQRFSGVIKPFAGLAAAILSSAKLFDKHKTTLVKALSN
ncbi:hypothetical protein SERLA73DRAFT_177383 [Serpula lacrymans var. lacrymans S7.3]|uniref:Peroxisomal membrane protein PEX11 n=2 Tax=Serpula lacrymans var. lacrymans TaxID=341189 RepID=F8PNX0_SERL3|nr:uncharacterized protein SERLADRAFT_460950 [Serpula lacrymans var. lacrymans S7.9]EGO01847.1 hypothetical protein SERLA73DRAFT_177383 [Serpula lacrymans var. lacrymans S7.3]EGO27474.1 hypothetical protein SERLADRAFT_460950 [Serpula lacrymans var. lacrymans S7.9]